MLLLILLQEMIAFSSISATYGYFLFGDTVFVVTRIKGNVTHIAIWCYGLIVHTCPLYTALLPRNIKRKIILLCSKRKYISTYFPISFLLVQPLITRKTHAFLRYSVRDNDFR